MMQSAAMSHSTSPSGLRRPDRTRQITVAVSAVLAIAGSFIGSGALGGTPIAEAAGGALSSDATLIAPAVPAFGIWSVIYAGLIAYTVWQLARRHRAQDWQRQLGYPIAASLLLNAAWILAVQAGQLILSAVVIVALLAVLAYVFVLCRRSAPSSRVEAVLLDGTMGLYLGWVTVATAANITSVLVAEGFQGFGLDPDLWAVAVIAVAGIVGVLLGLYGHGRIAPMLALTWGMAWIAVARFTGEPSSVPAAVAACAGAAAVVLATILIRLRQPGPSRRDASSRTGVKPAE